MLILFCTLKIIPFPQVRGSFSKILKEGSIYRIFLFSIAVYAFKNIFAGVLITAILFASVHSQYPTSMQLIVGLASVFFSIAYIRPGTLLAALWAHQLSDMILDSILI